MDAPSYRDVARFDDDRALHARLIRRDPTAPSDLAVAHLEPLVGALRRAFPRGRFPAADDALLETVAHDLILDLAERPEQYDPDRGGLAAYLRMAARRDVLNAVEKEHRRARRLAPLEDVELSAPARNREWTGAADPADALARAVDPATIASARGEFDTVEWEVVQLMADGERRTPIFAQILGLADRPPPEQEREVKRVKDRLKKRLQRLRPRVRRDD